MSTEIRIPKLGVSMSEGTLTEWLVDDGAAVSEGALIYSLETEKSVQEIEAPVSGVLRRVGEPGTLYQVGDLIGHIE